MCIISEIAFWLSYQLRYIKWHHFNCSVCMSKKKTYKQYNKHWTCLVGVHGRLWLSFNKNAIFAVSSVGILIIIRVSWWLDKTIEINRKIILYRPLKWWILLFKCFEKSDISAVFLIGLWLDIGSITLLTCTKKSTFRKDSMLLAEILP